MGHYDKIRDEDLEEFEYPLYMQALGEDLVVKFTSLKEGTVIVGSRWHRVGEYEKDWNEHTDKYWVDVTDQYKDKSPTIEEPKKDGNKYHVTIHDINGNGSVTADVYAILNACPITNPALQHLVKKALFAGSRGHKDKLEDLDNIIESAIRAKELEVEK